MHDRATERTRERMLSLDDFYKQHPDAVRLKELQRKPLIQRPGKT